MSVEEDVEEEGEMTNETETQQPERQVQSPTRHADAALTAIDALLDNPTQTAADMSYGVDAGGCWRCNMGEEEVDELGLCAFCRDALSGEGDVPAPRGTPLRYATQREVNLALVEARQELERTFYAENSLYTQCNRRATQAEHRIWSRELMAKVQSLHTTMQVSDDFLTDSAYPVREVSTDALILLAADQLSVVIHPRDCRVEIRSPGGDFNTTLTARWSPTTHAAEHHGGPADKTTCAIPGRRWHVAVEQYPDSLRYATDPLVFLPAHSIVQVTYIRDGWNQATRSWVYRPMEEVNARG